MDATGHGRFRLFFSASDPGFVSPDCGPDECGSGTAVLYANSTDGLNWERPGLGLWGWRGEGAHRGVVVGANRTNILFQGSTSVAVFRDPSERNASRRFKAWGNLARGMIGPERQGGGRAGAGGAMPWKRPQVGGLAVSADGLAWTDYRELQNTSDGRRGRWRFDAQATMFFDARRQVYVGLDRAFRPCKECGDCPIWWQPHSGCQEHRGPACTAAQCNRTVRAVGSVTSASRDFVDGSFGENVEVFAAPTPEHQFYSTVVWPFADVYLAIVMVFDALDPPNTYGRGKIRCELAMSADPAMGPGSWRRIAPGTEFIPHGPELGPGLGSFDSHICFATAAPFRKTDAGEGEGEEFIYFMGGDGPHYSPPYPDPLHRNTSLGLATLRPDRFVAVKGPGSGNFELEASGRQLTITADTAVPGGSVTIGWDGVPCTPVTDANVTDFAVRGCGELTAGQRVQLQIRISGQALVYIVGFTDDR